jgi:hypothetical protein
MKPELVFVDVGYRQDTVRDFVAESGRAFWGVKGFSRLNDEASNRNGSKLVSKGRTRSWWTCSTARPPIIEAQANAWKSWMHARLRRRWVSPGR